MKATNKETVHGAIPNETSIYMSTLVHEVILAKDLLAKISAECKRVTSALEDVIEGTPFLGELGTEGENTESIRFTCGVYGSSRNQRYLSC